MNMRLTCGQSRGCIENICELGPELASIAGDCLHWNELRPIHSTIDLSRRPAPLELGSVSLVTELNVNCKGRVDSGVRRYDSDGEGGGG